MNPQTHINTTNGSTAHTAHRNYREEWVLVTPELAREWLTSRAQNRHISAAHVEALAYAMTTGQYKANPHGIIFDENNKLIDGQHRLSAVVQSNTAVRLHVTWGVPADVGSIVDQGRTRTLADAERILTGDVYASKKTAIVSSLFRLETNRITRMSRQLYLEILNNIGQEHVNAVVQNSRHRVPASMAAAFAYARPVDPARLDALRESLLNRDVLPGTQAAMLRVLGDSAAIAHKPTDALLKLMRGIQAYLEGETIERLHVNESGYLWLQEQRENRGFKSRVVPAGYFTHRKKRPEAK